MRNAILTTLVVLVVMLVGAPPAVADDTRCTGFLTGTFQNLIVPENETCILHSSLVLGNLKALPNSRLFADSDEIRGNVEGDKADLVEVYDNPATPGRSLVGGNIQAHEGNEGVLVCGTELPRGNIQVQKFAGPDTFVLIGDDGHCRARQDFGGGNILTKGNIKVEENTVGVFIGDALGIDDNRVGQNLQVVKNRGPGSKTVNRNTGPGNLQCFENLPPFNGSGNTFPREEGQCN